MVSQEPADAFEVIVQERWCTYARWAKSQATLQCSSLIRRDRQEAKNEIMVALDKSINASIETRLSVAINASVSTRSMV